jgi:hypothetical protein
MLNGKNYYFVISIWADSPPISYIHMEKDYTSRKKHEQKHNHTVRTADLKKNKKWIHMHESVPAHKEP